METKERILLAALELAAQKGLGSVSMTQIAEKAGMKKPSLYNHFESREEIIREMYSFLRERSKQQLSLTSINYGEFVKDKSAFQALSEALTGYMAMTSQNEMLTFYKVIYSQRTVDAAAAQIMREETERMILETKNLFYALQAHDKLFLQDADMAATSFAMTVHAIMDYLHDCENSGAAVPKEMLTNYIRWFCEHNGGVDYE